ncbi:hypothetical protein B0T21DRAFT_81903 [Apiosordaria backusii]|uniref:Secreted protein n=1 Tax=Apiosordaria backusii TaxID=314023 RepID=A0AA40A3X0_9PEZI|nr:hypothetical protein B0T21DRAFT_81903 [Apiosordaria backusii]
MTFLICCFMRILSSSLASRSLSSPDLAGSIKSLDMEESGEAVNSSASLLPTPVISACDNRQQDVHGRPGYACLLSSFPG